MADAETDATPDAAPEPEVPQATTPAPAAPASDAPTWPTIEPEAPKGYDQTTGAFTS